MIKILTSSDINQILDVEKKAFIPPIQATEEKIINRIEKGHMYLGNEINGRLIGTLAFRYAHFVAEFDKFIEKYPNFDKYAEEPNDPGANAVFVYSLGIIPDYRNAANAQKLLLASLTEATGNNMNYLVGDARIPSFNGSCGNPGHEQFERNKSLQKAVCDYFKKGSLERKIIEEDPVAGFYLKICPDLQILGITGADFWENDFPCGGHMVIQYLECTGKPII